MYWYRLQIEWGYKKTKISDYPILEGQVQEQGSPAIPSDTGYMQQLFGPAYNILADNLFAIEHEENTASIIAIISCCHGNMLVYQAIT
jgi:hypothetical protein